MGKVAMTIIIGARCLDGVALVGDRRMVRHGGLEPGLPELKLREFRGVVFARVGLSPFFDALERLLPGNEVISCWDLSDAAGEVVAKYEGFKDDRPLFPVAGVVDGTAYLYQVQGGFPLGEIAYQAWGLGEEYGAWGRLFCWTEMPVDLAWKVMAVLIGTAAKGSLVVGDGIDAALVRDGGGIEIITDTGKVWDRAQLVVDKVLAVVRTEMERGLLP